jgi:DNA-binding NarL/FixJ family response regulator
MLVPHLHQVLVRVLGGAQKESSATNKAITVLTPREQEVLQWLCSGKTNWEIAQVLHISESAIKNHVQSILKKLHVSTRTQAVTLAIAEGLLAK